MKRRIFFLVLFCVMFLFGCQNKAQGAIVTSIRVDLIQNDRHTQYTLVEEGQMGRVLDCLRLLGSGDTARLDPERILGDTCRIRVGLRDGTYHVYRHAGDRYLSVDSHSWYQVDPKQSEKLYDILSNFQ